MSKQLKLKDVEYDWYNGRLMSGTVDNISVSCTAYPLPLKEYHYDLHGTLITVDLLNKTSTSKNGTASLTNWERKVGHLLNNHIGDNEDKWS